MHIPKNETRTFIFDMEVVKDVNDGKYPIYWTAYINGKAYARAGEQAHGFGIIAFVSAILIVIIIWKEKDKIQQIFYFLKYSKSEWK